MYYSSLWEFSGLRQGLVNRYGNDHGFVPFCSNHNHTISYAWLGWPLWTIYVTNDHGYLPLVVNTPRSFPRSWLIIRFVTRLTRRVSLVEQELPTLTEHLSSPPDLCSCYSIFSFICMFSRSLFVLLFFFFWPLGCLFFFDIRILITPLVSSNSSYKKCTTGLLIRVARRVPIVEQEPDTLLEYMDSAPDFVWFVWLNLQFSV